MMRSIAMRWRRWGRSLIGNCGRICRTRMYAATGDRRYIGYLDEEWAKTSDLLYDKQEHLYARDADYLTKTEANGKKMFWSRGNGWVMGGIVRTLEYLPKDDPAG